MNTHAILGTDFSDSSDKLLHCLSEYKKLGIEKITLVHALGIKNIQAFEDFLRRGADVRLSEQKAMLEKQGFEVDARIETGLPAMELERAAKELGASLIVIGAHGATWSRAILGSTASEILHQMKTPVLLVAMEVIETGDTAACEVKCKSFMNHVLYLTDFSDSSEHAFQWIKNREVAIPRITLMHVQDEVKIGGHLKDRLDEFNRIDKERLERLGTAFREAHPDTEISIALEYGRPLQSILKFIKENGVTLTVMGSQGRGFIPEIFLGSLSHQVARHAECNLLLVPLPRL